jgi:competence protein ComEC
VNNQRVFYAIFFGFLLAIFISSFVDYAYFVKYIFLAFSVILFVSGIILLRCRVILKILAILLLSFFFGLIRMEFKEARVEGVEEMMGNFVDKKVIVVGQITNEPAEKEYGHQSIIHTETIRLDPGKRYFLLKEKPEYQTISVSENILVTSGPFPKVKYGDRVSVLGRLDAPENFETDSGRDFDYISYLAKDDVFYKISQASMQVISSGNGAFISEKLFALKSAFVKNLNLMVKEPESSLLVGLLLGSKNSLGAVWSDRFAQAGVSHIVALSGYNITIVAEGVMAVLSFLPRAMALSGGALGIILFAILTGGSATVMRASIMALFVILAKATTRTYDVVRALFLAAFFMIIHNPKILVFDLSFQLSFLSTLALIFVSPLLEKWFSFVTEKYKIREVVLATIATQIFVLPFIIYKMGLVSFVALPANLLILPVIPFIMLVGFLAGLFAFFIDILAWPFAYISSWLLSYMLSVIKFFADLSFSFTQIKNFPLSAVIFCYLVWAVIIWRSKIIFRRPTSLD